MSIKNIIQQENDLQEMSTQSLANYLNNPTGQYNPYLVAGELQRKEAFAQRQMTEAPQGTVVDELVATAAPMGGMPMGGISDKISRVIFLEQSWRQRALIRMETLDSKRSGIITASWRQITRKI